MSHVMKSEEIRQATILAAAIQKQIEEIGKQFETPILNAVAGALVGVEAGILATIADAKHRKALRRSMDLARPRALAEALSRDPKKCAVVIVPEIYNA